MLVSNLKRIIAGAFIALLAIIMIPEKALALQFETETVGAQESEQDPNVDQYTVDNSHTSVVFAVSHFGLSYTYGRFNECTGKFGLKGGELSPKGFSFEIKAESIDTNNAERDKHLRGPDFFDTVQFPELKFVTTGFTKKKMGLTKSLEISQCLVKPSPSRCQFV